MAYDQLEPFGQEREDLRMGIIAATVANSQRTKGQRAYRPKDFMPEFGIEEKPQQTVEEMKVAFLRHPAFKKAWEAQHGDDR